MEKTNEKIASFDCLRFIACIFVILHHTGIKIFNKRYFGTAYLAVEIFFVLSGFLLANSYYKSLSRGSSVVDNCKMYFFSRIKRLYPEYIFATLIYAFLMNAFVDHVSMKSFMLNVVMMAGWGGVYNIVDGVWFVVVLLWCGCFLFNLMTVYKEKAFLWILPMISLFCLFFLTNNGHCIFGHQLGIAYGLISEGTIRGMLGITVGIYCFQICKKIKETDLRVRDGSLSPLLFILELISVSLLVNAILIRTKPDVSDFNVYFYISYIVGILYFKKEKLLKFLSCSFWCPLSKLSYMIYLTHVVVICFLKKYCIATFSALPPWLGFGMVVASSVMFAALCYLLSQYFFTKLKDFVWIHESKN